MFSEVHERLMKKANELRVLAEAMSEEEAFLIFAGHAFNKDFDGKSIIKFDHTREGSLRAYWVSEKGGKLQLVLDDELRARIKLLAGRVLSAPFQQGAIAAAVATFMDDEQPEVLETETEEN